MDERLKRAVEILESWAEGQLDPPYRDTGICFNLAWRLRLHTWTSEELIARATKSWPEYSGNRRFPVPHEHLSPESASTAQREVPKWGDDAYGQARRRLCQHVADWIRANPEAAAEFLRG